MQIIRCEICGVELGAVVAPSSAQIRKTLAGTSFAALAGMIPPSISEDMVTLLAFRCIPHKEVTSGGKEGAQISRKEDGEESDRKASDNGERRS